MVHVSRRPDASLRREPPFGGLSRVPGNYVPRGVDTAYDVRTARFVSFCVMRATGVALRWSEKAEIVVACAVVPAALEVCPASRVLDWIRRVPAGRGATVAPERLALHVDRLLARAPGPWRYTCLRRAAVLAAVLRRHGRPATVVLGVRRGDDGALEAHAWLRCGDEEPFLEPPPPHAGDYVPLQRVGPPGR